MAVSLYVVAAICGNFHIESYVNPGVYENGIVVPWDYQYDDDHPNQGGFGLGQWTNVGSHYDRLWNLHQYCLTHMYNENDGNAQCQFIVVENVWNASRSSMGFNSLSEFLASTSTDLNSLTYDWLVCWEGIGTDTLTQRQTWARTFYDYIYAHQNDDRTTYQWISENRSLSPLEQCMNAMCVFYAMNGYYPPSPGPGPGPTPTQRKKMPLWMMLRYY